MNPYDENNSAAWWVAGIVGFGVAAWKLFFGFRRDHRDDSEGRSRLDLIDQLQEEIKNKNEFIVMLEEANSKLSEQLDKETERRRVAEDTCFECGQREKRLLERIRNSTGGYGEEN